jgi:hypothetical protein
VQATCEFNSSQCAADLVCQEQFSPFPIADLPGVCCPPVFCRMMCPRGMMYAYDSNGCQQCRCVPAPCDGDEIAGFCENNICPRGQHCDTITVAGASYSLCCPLMQSQCTSNDHCAADFYCQKSSCNAEFGSCAPRPGICTLIYSPVCGCSGKLFSNPCAAAAAGENVGPCVKCPKVCPRLLCLPLQAGCKFVDPEFDVCNCQTSCGDQVCTTAMDLSTVSVFTTASTIAMTATTSGADVMCRQQRDCPTGQFCKKLSCDSQVGVCASPKKGCNPGLSPQSEC